MIKVSNVFLAFFLFSLNAYAFDQDFYIWQKSWNDEIKTAIHEVSPKTSAFTTLSAIVNISDGRAMITKVGVNWKYFSDTNKPLVIAIRILAPSKKLMKEKSVNEFSLQVVEAVKELFKEASSCGINIRGVQFDYDSPTSKLNDYGEFLKRFQSNLPGVEVSITTLPSWMQSDDFGRLISNVSFYVLQLHSLEKPKQLDDGFEIFDTSRAEEYVQTAIRYGRPFFISLPTYGYEVAFDKAGKFAGLRAENNRVHWADGLIIKIIMADPDKVSKFLQYIQLKSKGLIRGVYWFRLPVESDDLNWGIKTIRSVMDGHVPATSFKIEIIPGGNGITQVYVKNNGEKNLSVPIAFEINWPQKQSPVYDVLGNFQKIDLPQNKGIEVIGPSPRIDKSILVGWFRNSNDAPMSIQTTEVTEYEGKTIP